METRKRKDVKKEETWALEDLYQNEDACREDARLLEEELKAFTARKGTLHQSGEILFETLEAYNQISMRWERVSVYANQHLHEDMGDPVRQKLAGEINVLQNRYGQEFPGWNRRF